ncbi:MAG: magnesium chelatase subunit D [Ideonella sp.]|nr:magnesium chelatase subunit D [Ideonella sp.]
MNRLRLSTDGLWAARLLAVDPHGLGGMWLRGPADEARATWLAAVRALLPADTPWRRVPLTIDDARLQGGLDLAASLAAGRPIAAPGLIAEAQGGVLVLPMAERAAGGLAGQLAAAIEGGAAVLIALDEGLPPDEALAPVLAERLALVLNPALWDHPDGDEPDFVGVAAARAALPLIPFDADAVQALCGAAQALGLDSLRPAWQAWRVACVAAACAGHGQVEHSDAELAARLVLAPRARSLPASPEASAEPPQAPSPAPPSTQPEHPPEPQAEPQPEEQASAESASPPSHSDNSETLNEQVLQAARAAIPPGLLSALAAGSMRLRQAGAAGRVGQSVAAGRGRSLGARRGLPRGSARLDLLATLRAAVPWQRLRQQARAQAGLPQSSAKLLLQRDDFHVRRQLSPQRCTTVFVVDASGSQALQRLAEAKGAVELLLADCYIRRDQVALLVFRGSAAELLLPPTRSLVRARRALAELPGGGGTPLAHGIAAATELALRLQAREGGRAQLVFLTDARANINLAGQPGREAAMQDATQAARRLAASGLRSLLIDTAARPQPQARNLAEAMAARYLALPLGQSQAVSAAVRGLG